MRRVMIIGGSGAGKSTLARRIGEITKLPVVHMDRLFWEPNWVEPDEDVFLYRVTAAIDQEEWVMDGNYSRTWPARLARADTVIFLDISTPRRFWRVINRTATSYGRDRPDMTAGCPDRLDFGFLFDWVLRYHWRARPKALALLASDGPASRLVCQHLTSPAAVDRFLAGLIQLQPTNP